MERGRARFRRLLEMGNVWGTAPVHLGPDGLRFDSIDIVGERLNIEGRMRFGEGPEHVPIHVRLHPLGVAVELCEGKHDFTIIEPKKGYARRLRENAKPALQECFAATRP